VDARRNADPDRGGRFEAVTVIAGDPSPRAHEIRDVLTRNNVPYGFLDRDSASGRQTLQALGLADGTPAGPDPVQRRRAGGPDERRGGGCARR
jgi:hypothetical protein